MPDPLPATIMPAQVATGVFPLLVKAVFDIENGKIKGDSGVPVPTKGSIVYGYVFSFGYLIQAGMITANRGRKGLRRTSRGGEDGKQSQS